MVLVRKTELACRNSWDQDLWDLAEQPLDLQHSTNIPIPISGGDSRDLHVAQVDMAVDDPARAGEMFTDRITSISMPTRSQLRPTSSAGGDLHAEDEAAASELQAARSSVRDARKRRQEQRHLERRKHQETLLKQAGDLLDTTQPEDRDDRDLARMRADEGPLTAKHQRRSDPPAAEPPAAPPVVGSSFERPRASAPRSVEFSATPPRFRGNDMPPASTDMPVKKASPSKPTHNGHQEQTQLKSGETAPMPSPTEIRRAIDQRQAAAEPVVEHMSEPRASKRRRTALDDVPVDLPPAVEPRRPTWVTGAGHVAQPAPVNLPRARAVDPIDRNDDVGSVRRCCATCRDFRQVGDGRTGWCTNAYAFGEKRMVQSDEIACRSSLGIWWLPHDGLWLEQADTTHHGRPTPLLDEVLGTATTERETIDQRSAR